MDWTAVLTADAENRRARLAAELLASPAHPTIAAKVRAFVAQGGGCRATFFNHRKRFAGVGVRRQTERGMSDDVNKSGSRVRSSRPNTPNEGRPARWPSAPAGRPVEHLGPGPAPRPAVPGVQAARTLVQARADNRASDDGGGAGGVPGAAAGRDVEARLPAVERPAGRPRWRSSPGCSRPSTGSRRPKQTTPQAGGGSAPGGSVTIDVTALLELAAWCRQRLDDPTGGTACPTPPDAPPPPRLTPTAAPPSDPPPVWAHLPADRQQQLRDLLGQLLARLHAATRRKEAGHE